MPQPSRYMWCEGPSRNTLRLRKHRSVLVGLAEVLVGPGRSGAAVVVARVRADHPLHLFDVRHLQFRPLQVLIQLLVQLIRWFTDRVRSPMYQEPACIAALVRAFILGNCIIICFWVNQSRISDILI